MTEKVVGALYHNQGATAGDIKSRKNEFAAKEILRVVAFGFLLVQYIKCFTSYLTQQWHFVV